MGLKTAQVALFSVLWCWLMGTVAEAAGRAPATVRFVAEAIAFTAVFTGEEVRLFFHDGQDVTLPRVASRRGGSVRYAAGDISLTVQRSMARLERHGLVYLVQKWDPWLDPWERARRAGVHFRAVGQEPGWMAEIRDGQRIELLLDYGETRIETPISPPAPGADGRTTTYRTPAHLPVQLTVIVTAGACYDGMSGEEFPASVTLRLGGSKREYHGCGRWLQ